MKVKWFVLGLLVVVLFVLSACTGVVAGLGLAYLTGKSDSTSASVLPDSHFQTKSGVLTGDDELFVTPDFLAYLSSSEGRMGPVATLNIMLKGGYDVPVAGSELRLDGKDTLRWADVIAVTFTRCGSNICYTATYDDSKINVPGKPECMTDGFRFHFKPYTIVDFADLNNGLTLVKDYSDLKLFRAHSDGDTLIAEQAFPEEGQTVSFPGTGIKVKRCGALYYYSALLAY